MTTQIQSIDVFKAVTQGNLDALKKYIESGGDLHVLDKTGEVARKALSRSKFYDSSTAFQSENYSLLHLACLYDQFQICECICQTDKDGKLISKKDASGLTPLEIAAWMVQPTKYMQLLLQSRGNVYSPECLGGVFYRLIWLRDINAAQLILKEVQTNNDELQKKLNVHILPELSNIVTQYICTKDAIVNMPDKKRNKYTPICESVSENDIPTVTWLLEQGASLEYNNPHCRHGTTLFQIAERKASSEMVELLKNAQAKRSM